MTTSGNDDAVDFDSVFNNTVLKEYVACNNREPKRYEAEFNGAAQAFARESYTAFLFTPRKQRREPLKASIIKLLLDLGLLPHGNGFATVARLIEISATSPDMSLPDVIRQFADSHNATVSAVEHIIDKCLNVYNDEFIERVVKHTGSRPFTAKDVLCDLAVSERLDYLSVSYLNE